MLAQLDDLDERKLSKKEIKKEIKLQMNATKNLKKIRQRLGSS